jgi:H+-transporting ATPase
MAFAGILMAPLPLSVILTVFAAAIVFAFILDAVKARIFRALEME